MKLIIEVFKFSKKEISLVVFKSKVIYDKYC